MLMLDFDFVAMNIGLRRRSVSLKDEDRSSYYRGQCNGVLQ